ncbi:hypothetical protein BKA61DRAFT_736763 [Leptodontidium sp. MPI-SDFR-AT-0119]|nr:hypothetical protein BKA61DRAFT_736763 [Leptodontidium sp. MPI-SDFR-AT-0119]
MKLQIIIPSFTPHFPELLEMLHSMACLITDISSISISLILSSDAEVFLLTSLLSDPTTKSCGSTYLAYNILPSSRTLTYPPHLTLHNLYTLLPSNIQNLTTPTETSDLVKKYGKYKYQSMKKLAAAAHFEYDYAILLDSEGLVIRPVAFKELVREWMKRPVVWKELAAVGSPRRNGWVVGINEGCARTLGRTMQNFGTGVSFWEGYTWILEKEIVMDMVNSPSRLNPNTDFFTRLLKAKSDIFEIVMYKIHIAGRKMEQSSSTSEVYTKYRILDIQETLIDYGLEAAYTRIPPNLDVISQRFPSMILEEPLQDLLVSFMKEYKFFFIYFDPGYLSQIPHAVLQEFLRKAPLAMTVSGTTGLPREFIPAGKGGWNMSYV